MKKSFWSSEPSQVCLCLRTSPSPTLQHAVVKPCARRTPRNSTRQSEMGRAAIRYVSNPSASTPPRRRARPSRRVFPDHDCDAYGSDQACPAQPTLGEGARGAASPRRVRVFTSMSSRCLGARESSSTRALVVPALTDHPPRLSPIVPHERLSEVVYTVSPMKVGVMGGLFKDFGSVMTKKLMGMTDMAIFGLAPTVGIYQYAVNFKENEKLRTGTDARGGTRRRRGRERERLRRGVLPRAATDGISPAVSRRAFVNRKSSSLHSCGTPLNTSIPLTSPQTLSSLARLPLIRVLGRVRVRQ